MTRTVMVLLVSLFISNFANALVDSFYITGTVPTSYSASDSNSLVLTGLRYKNVLCVYNESSSRIAVNVDAGSTTTAPASTGVREIVFAANSGGCRETTISSTVYLRSRSGSSINAASTPIYGEALSR